MATGGDRFLDLPAVHTSIRRLRPRSITTTVAAGALLASFVGGTAAASARSVATPSAPVPSVTTSLLTPKGDHPTPWSAKVVVPVLHGGTPAASAKITAALRALAERTLAGFVHELPTAPAPKGIPDTSTLQSWVTTDLVTGDLVSLTTDVEIFDAGAAQPLDLVETATFDARTGAPLKLADLFRPASPYLAVLSRQSRAQLRRTYASADPPALMDPGTTPNAANFTGWSLTPFGLEIAFSQGNAGPSVLSSPSVMIPFSALAPLGRPGGPLALAEGVRNPKMALLPATTPPVVPECYLPQRFQAATTPNTCAGGRVNVAAWNSLVGYASPLLGLGAKATAHQVLLANCQLSDVFQLPPSQARSFTALAHTYYGWPFSVQAALAGFPAKCPPFKAPAAG